MFEVLSSVLYYMLILEVFMSFLVFFSPSQSCCSSNGCFPIFGLSFVDILHQELIGLVQVDIKSCKCDTRYIYVLLLLFIPNSILIIVT